MKTFYIKMSAPASAQTTITVTAETEAEAIEQAQNDLADWYWDLTSVEYNYADVVNVSQIP